MLISPILAAGISSAAIVTVTTLGHADPARMAKLRITATADATTIRAQACLGARCVARDVALPGDLRPPTAESIAFEGGRPGVLVEAAAAQGEGRFVVLLAADDDGGVHELLRGWIDRLQGSVPGERQQKVLLRERGAAATSGESLVIGTRYEHVSACGRPLVMSAKRLDAAALEWRPTANRVLSDADRAGAAKLFAKRSPQAFDRELPRLLSSTVASSAEGGSHGGLTDADTGTSWTEAAEGPGEGEMVVMAGSTEVTIVGFQLVPRATAENAADRAAPRSFYLASERELFHVTMPEDAAQQPPGTSYELRLPKPIRSDCVALVLGDAYADRSDQVTIAELRAITSLDGDGSPDKLVAMLEEQGGRAGAAEALLARGGGAAVRAAIAAFERLGEGGRQRALEVIDSGSCEDTASFYIAQLVGIGKPERWDPEGDALVDAMRQRLRRCREVGRDALAKLVTAGPGDRARGLAARELAAIAPRAAVQPLVGAFEGASPGLRADLRRALAAAATDAKALPELERTFSTEAFSTRPLFMQVDLLRALGPQIGTVTGAAAAFAATATDRSFRTRYLLQQPAAELAKREDRNAVRYLAESMRHDESPHVRARAAQVAVGIAALAEDLAMALSDSEPRVREATLTSLAGDTKPSLSAAVTQRIDASLGSDRWTFVRIAAAQALASQTISPDSETALIRALEDESIAVRRAALTALGKSRTARAGERVHEVADDADAPVEVRTAAIASLGQMCRKPSVPLLYKLALRAGTPELPYDRPLGMAALAALGEIHPADVAEKLLPLIRERRVPQQIRSIARGVVEQPGRCAK